MDKNPQQKNLTNSTSFGMDIAEAPAAATSIGDARINHRAYWRLLSEIPLRKRRRRRRRRL